MHSDSRASLGAAVLACLLAACGSSQAPPAGSALPGAAGSSLYSGPEPRPGPPILYAPPPRAPQLENTGIWRAVPILISGASAYRDGEFLYQDFLFDDHGANTAQENVVDIAAGLSAVADDIFSRRGGSYRYPTDPVYAGNAADLVEFRVRALSDTTAFRVTLNTLLDPDRVAFTIALGDSPAPQALPRGANVVARARWAVTVFEHQAELVDLDDGTVLASGLPVAIDLERAQIELHIPRSVWDPGRERVAMMLGVGLWDAGAGAYLVPGPVATESTPGGALGLAGAPAAFFNIAFRYDEPGTELLPSLFTDLVLNTAWWRNQRQGAALAAGDISAFRAQVDFAKLRDGLADDMTNQPGGTPTVGAISRIFPSRFTHAPGVNPANDCGGADGCLGRFGGQLQPYALYVPDRAVPEGGFGFTLLMHSLAANYHQYHATNHQRQLGERGRGYLVATPAGRGPDGWYVETAGADAFEVWNDVARHYPLNPDHAAASGVSMGGYGSYRFATRYPDLFARVHTIVGPPAVGIWVPPLQPSPGPQSNTFESLASLRHVPILNWVATTDELVPYPGPFAQAQELDRLGYRYRFESYAPAEHLTFSFNDEYQPGADFLGDHAVVRNPARISYVVNPRMDFANVGMVADRAYWLSGLTTRDGEPGTIDAISEGFGETDAPVSSTQFGAGVLSGGILPGIAFVSQSRDWGASGATAPANRLRLTLRNIATLPLHPDRARLDCDALLDLDSDGAVEIRFAGCERVETR
jgi:hypothetical protein